MTTQFVMRALNIILSEHVYWVSTGAADMSGSFSGYSPGDLSGIAVDYTRTITVTIPGGIPMSGVAGGDLSGLFPNPSVSKVNNVSVSGTPIAGQVITALSGTTSSWQTPGTGSSTANKGTYQCDVSVNLHDVVYLKASDGYVYSADADDISKQPVIGIVSLKPTATTAEVTYSGEVSGFSGLSPSSTYYLSITPGQISTSTPITTGSIIQHIGFAKSSTVLVVMIDRDFVML